MLSLLPLPSAHRRSVGPNTDELDSLILVRFYKLFVFTSFAASVGSRAAPGVRLRRVQGDVYRSTALKIGIDLDVVAVGTARASILTVSVNVIHANF